LPWYEWVPTWFAAVGTVGAFAVSFWLLARAEERRRQESAERRAAQARHVSAWVAGIAEVTVAEDPSVDLDETEYHQRREVTYVTHNNSDEPVYQVHLLMRAGTQGDFPRYLGMMGPGERRQTRIHVGMAQPVGDKSPEITFIDSAGVHWHRGRYSALEEIDPRKPPDLSAKPGAYPSIEENPYMKSLPTEETKRGVQL
jgi:hypothetical protein